MARVILLSGRVSSGKTTLSAGLQQKFGAVVVKTKELIQHTAGGSLPAERESLQKYGERLDRETGGKWVADALLAKIKDLHPEQLVIVDAIRILPQADRIREALRSRVLHIHLEAALEELASRYERRKPTANIQELPTYSDVTRNSTEQRIDDLARAADIVIDTQRSRPADVLARAAGNLGLYGRGYDRLVDVLVGGQYGSEGKGNIAFYLAPDYQILVRVGGPNAGHTVFSHDGPYIHHQLPSGTRNSSARLLIGPGAVIAPESLLKEINECAVVPARLTIDPQAMVIQQSDRDAECELVKQIGSTGQGVGQATARRILGRGGKTELAKDVPALNPFVGETQAILEAAFAAGQRVFLEGTQGTGLSLFHGQYPYVTSRDTTVAGTLAEAGISPGRVNRVIMACRPYPIRVESPRDATSGPMSQEITWEIVSARSGIPFEQLQQTEKTSTTKKRRRVAEFDWALLRRAASLNAPTDIAVTFADYISSANSEAFRFEQLTTDTIRFIEEVESIAAAPVSLISTGFGRRTIIDRRTW